jgi:PKD repeat protein
MKRAMIRVPGILVLLLAAVSLAGCFGPVARPVADFVWCPDGSSGGLDYWFTSTSTTVPNHWIELLRWEFGDDSPPLETAWDAHHRFDDEKVYRVTLTVRDDRGVSGTVTKDVPVAMAAFVHAGWQLTLGWPARVTGVVQNRFNERLEFVVVKAKFYDADGVRLSDGTAEITDLDPGEKAEFSITAIEYSTRIFHATVEVDSFSSYCPNGWPRLGGDEANR